MKAIFNSDDLYTAFFFTDDDRSMFDDLEYGSVVEISVKDAAGNVVAITFSTTRNAFLGTYHRRIHGEVLGTEDGLYREIQIRLNKSDPRDDTIGVFLQAPPLKI